LRVGGGGLVDLHDPPADRRVHLRDALGRLDLTQRFPRGDLGAGLGQLQEDDVAQGVLGVVGDAHPERAVLAGRVHPLVLGGVPELLGNHCVLLQETGVAYRNGAGSRTAVTSTPSGRSSTVTVPPALCTLSTTPPGIARAGSRVCGSPTAVMVYGPRSRWPSTRTAPSSASTK